MILILALTLFARFSPLISSLVTFLERRRLLREMNGCDLLTQFRLKGDEQAFSELVRRYTNLVYSAAKRRVSDDTLAQEATQIVFIRLAKAAPKLGSDAELTAWLHRTTVHVAIDLWRSDSRRRIREEKAASMPNDADDTAEWTELAPVLDEALNTLDDVDRQTLLLRFFERKTMRDLGAVLGVTEDAAKMRVSRAIDRLRQQLSARGVTCAVSMITALLSERVVEAAPAQLATTLGTINFASHATTATSAAAAGAGVPVVVKLAIGGAIGVVAIVLLLMRPEIDHKTANETASRNVVKVQRLVAVESNQQVVEEQSEPDPRKLLQGVISARQKIRSGTIALEISSAREENSHIETNRVQMTVTFDGDKRWVESNQREYSYTARGDEAVAVDEERIKRERLTREQAVEAGLLEGFDAHVITMFDGSAQFKYRESDGRSNGATIDEMKGSSDYFFDPRILGLTSHHAYFEKLGDVVSSRWTRSVQLLGRESLEGTEAWHIRIEPVAGGTPRDFWVDVLTPTRVIRYESNGDIVSSKYEGTTPDDPIPTEVLCSTARRGERWPYQTRFVRKSAEYSIAVDPSLWTLAGLHMAIETDVVDLRISRSIGFWTGDGLSEYPQKRSKSVQAAPDRAKLLSVLENDPGSDAGLQAAQWIIRNTPDGLDTDKAGDVIRRYHIQNPELKKLAEELERLRHRSSTNLLAAMLDQNPNAEVRATACFGLGVLYKEQFAFGSNKVATAEAANYFERVVNEFASAGDTGAKLAPKAKAELNELRNLVIGKPAPETSGVDLDGNPLNVSDHRGKIVVLFFWSRSESDLLEQDKIARQFAGKPVSFIGVNRDEDPTKAKALIEQHGVSWPSFRDGRNGAIFSAWNVESWPKIIILDQKGMIRFRDLRGWEVVRAVEKLLQE